MPQAACRHTTFLFLLAGCFATTPAIAQWEYTAGPYAQDITTVHPDDNSPGTLFVALTNGNLCVSRSGGKTWTRVSTITHRRRVYRFVQHPESPGTFYAATEAGAFVSSNHGKDWAGMKIGEPGTAVRTLAIDPWTPSVIFAGTRGKGMFKTTDGGMSWIGISSTSDPRLGSAEVFDITIDPSKPNTVYAALTALGIVRSTDAGTTWRTLTEEFSAQGSRTTHLLLGKTAGRLIYGTDAGSIVKSINGGDSWSPSRNGLQFDRILSLESYPDNPDLVFAGTETGIIQSTDFGTTWSPAGSGLPRVATLLTISPKGPTPIMYAYGNGAGLRASSDKGLSWYAADTELGGATVDVMTTDKTGEQLLAGAGGTCLSFFQSLSGGWIPSGEGIAGGEITSLSPYPDQPGSFFATTPAGVFQTTNGGLAWQSATSTLRMTPFLFESHPSINTRLYAAGEQGLFVSTNRGKSWVQSRPLGTHWYVRSLTFSPTNAGVILAGTSNGGIVATQDGGFTWETARYGLPAEAIAVVTLDDKDLEVYYAYTPSGDCYRSINKGLEWNRYLPPWKMTDSVRIASDHFQANSVVALVNNKELYYSSSGGGTWFRLPDREVNADVRALHWNATSATVFAGTTDKGVYKLSLRKEVQEFNGE